ncbi:hypothetical protein WR164_08790 [Philodulcilactobacillus myokoensis]|uniref:DUF2929 family protein n=1 Tax=Philodulcilactobacillus myokoensis TaxID=2929573 RepID=A0A9W6B105_9LACO|nr:DUF2929 family protein [Philodulcilactobacillus myokoensis]GLB46900.1 hypothetical protein WR164_08790 [Philodulcilactobacillus myokoensis]
MRWIIQNITAMFYAFLFGDIIGYIGNQLLGLQYSNLEFGIIFALITFVTSNCVMLMADRKVK